MMVNMWKFLKIMGSLFPVSWFWNKENIAKCKNVVKDCDFLFYSVGMFKDLVLLILSWTFSKMQEQRE